MLASIITKFGELENEMCYGTSRKDDFIDTVVCLFIRKIMEQIDAINLLFSIGSFTQTQIILTMSAKAGKYDREAMACR